MPLVDEFLSAFSSLGLGPGAALVAVSGGSDSLALLELLVAISDQHRRRLMVAHVDHGIHPDSSSVASQVMRVAERHGLPVDSRKLNLGSAASETSARTHRYRALREMRQAANADYILLGHTRDDQVETVLMRVLQGSGPAGLAGIQAVSGELVRPLLPFRREQLAHYLRSRGVKWWEDPANEDMRHVRSWLRHDLVPHLEGRIPDVARSLVNLADQAAESRAAWDAVLDVLPGLDWRDEPDGGSVAAEVLAGYDSSLSIGLIQALGRRVGCGPIGLSRAKRVLDLASKAKSGRTMELSHGWRVEIAFGRLRFLEPVGAEEWVPTRLGGDREGHARCGPWKVTWGVDAAPERQTREASEAWFVPATLTVRVGRAGDKIVPLGGVGHRAVVRCMQEARIPRSRRASWPVVEAAGQVVWVPGVCRSNELVPDGGAEALRVDVRYG